MNFSLRYEICRAILGLVGVEFNGTLGQFGLTRDNFRVKSTLDLVYDDDQVRKHTLFAGEIDIEQMKVRVLLADLTAENELILILRAANNPIYGIRLVIDSEKDCLFSIRTDLGWEPASLTAQCRALIAMDTIATFGLIWQPCEKFDDLFAALTAFATQEA